MEHKLARIGLNDREMLRQISDKISASAPDHEPTQKFASVLSAMVVADFADCLDELYEVAQKAHEYARRKVEGWESEGSG